MQFVRLLPVILSGIIILAHFLRHQQWLSVALVFVGFGLLLVPRKWAARLVQVGLVLASLEWVGTLFQLVQQRQAMGMEWTRLAVILGGVALFTLLSALVFWLPALKARYGLIGKEQSVNK